MKRSLVFVLCPILYFQINAMYILQNFTELVGWLLGNEMAGGLVSMAFLTCPAGFTPSM